MVNIYIYYVGLVHVLKKKLKNGKKHASPVGFEPTRGDPNGFLVHRLNHSATTTACKTRF